MGIRTFSGHVIDMFKERVNLTTRSCAPYILFMILPFYTPPWENLYVAYETSKPQISLRIRPVWSASLVTAAWAVWQDHLWTQCSKVYMVSVAEHAVLSLTRWKRSSFVAVLGHHGYFYSTTWGDSQRLAWWPSHIAPTRPTSTEPDEILCYVRKCIFRRMSPCCKSLQLLILNQLITRQARPYLVNWACLRKMPLLCPSLSGYIQYVHQYTCKALKPSGCCVRGTVSSKHSSFAMSANLNIWCCFLV